MQHGESLGVDALLHQVPFHGVGDGEQMRLLAMPERRGEALDVADRGRAAEAFEPAAPPTGGGERGLDDVGAMLRERRAPTAARQRDSALPRDSPGMRVEAEAVHFGDGGAAAF